jgi:hypothetical protein
MYLQKEKTVRKQSIYPDDGLVIIRREVKGRKGKTIRAVFSVLLANRKLK